MGRATKRPSRVRQAERTQRTCSLLEAVTASKKGEGVGGRGASSSPLLIVYNLNLSPPKLSPLGRG